MNLKSLAIASTFLLAAVAPAQAAVVFSDNFNAETQGLNYNGFANFAVTAGSVDLIGTGFFDFYPGNGNYVDLDGSTAGDNPAGQITTNMIFGPGAYSLSFDLGGSTRGDTNTVLVQLGDFSSMLTLASAVPLTTFSFTFNTAASGALSFANLGRSDSFGLILDNVEVSSSAVPEPSSWGMLILGFAITGLALRRRRIRLTPSRAL